MFPFLIAYDRLKPLLEKAASRFPSVEFRFCAPDPEAREVAMASDVVAVATEDLPRPGPQLASLRWVHLLSAGYDFLLGRELPTPDLIITNSSGAYTSGIAEFVVMRMMMHARNAEAIAENQKNRAWAREALTGTTLRGRKVLVIGNGSVGHEVARISEALRMQVYLAGRKDREALPILVADADYILLAASLNPSSRGILNHAVFEKMRRRPYLVNISRGALIDSEDLVDALRSGILSGAALDVFEQEPLPRDSPLYEMPNVSISPHISGVFHEVEDELVKLLCRNLECFLRNEKLPNEISLREV